MKRIKLAIALGLGLLVAVPQMASAQQDPATQIIPSLELEQADVRDALRALFRNVNVNYSIDPVVQGTVTVSLKNVLFETALTQILRQVDATYRINSGVYEIVRKERVEVTPDVQTVDLPTGTNTVIRRIYIRSADPAFIFRMLRGSTDTFLTPEISQASGRGVGTMTSQVNFGGARGSIGGTSSFGQGLGGANQASAQTSASGSARGQMGE